MVEVSKKVVVLPLLIGNLLYTKGRRLVGFYVQVYNKPGALADIARIFKDYQVNIWNMVFASRVQLGTVGSGFIIADFTGLDVKPETIVEKLEKLDVIDYVEIVKPQHPNVLYDPYHFPIVDDEESRFIFIGEKGMESIVGGLRSRFGVGGIVFLYHEGVIFGEYICNEIINKLKVKDLREALRIYMLLAFAQGRFRGEIIDYSYGSLIRRDVVVTRLYMNWECETAKRLGIEGPASHFERGSLAGLIQAYTGRKVKVAERACIARGDEYCEFIVEFEG